MARRARPSPVPSSLLALLALVALVGACSGRRPPQARPRPSTTTAPPTTTSTVVADTTTTVPPSTTTTVVVIAGGQASLNGTVAGPAGPVEGATVRVERLVGEAVARADVLTQPDGTWKLESIKGGRYRVRAWKRPDLALLDPATFFLGAAETLAVPLTLESYGGPVVTPAVAPDPPPVNAPAHLAVEVSSGQVDDQGRVRISPLAGVVAALAPSPAFRLESTNPVPTDQQGRAVWRLRCLAAGPLSPVVHVSRPSPTTTSAPAAAPTATATTAAPATSLGSFSLVVSPCGGPALTTATAPRRTSPTSR